MDFIPVMTYALIGGGVFARALRTEGIAFSLIALAAWPIMVGGILCAYFLEHSDHLDSATTPSTDSAAPAGQASHSPRR